MSFLRFNWIALAGGVAVLFAPLSVSAAVIANYAFTSGAATSGDADGTTTASDFTSGAFTGGSKTTTTVNISSSSHNAFIRSSASGDTTESAAVSNDDSWSFTLTPHAGVTMSLTSLDFQHGNNSQATGVSFTSNFIVRSSLDGFSSNLGTGVYSRTTSSTSATFSTANIDLSGAEFQNLTAPITFKIFEFDASTNSQDIARLDNVVVNGTTVPEPTGLVVLGLAAALWGRRRGR